MSLTTLVRSAARTLQHGSHRTTADRRNSPIVAARNVRIADTATVADRALLFDAIVADRATVVGTACVDNSTVSDHGRVSGAAQLDHATVSGSAHIADNARVKRSTVDGAAHIDGEASIEAAHVTGNAHVGGQAVVVGSGGTPSPVVGGDATIDGNAVIGYHAHIDGTGDVAWLDSSVDGRPLTLYRTSYGWAVTWGCSLYPGRNIAQACRRARRGIGRRKSREVARTHSCAHGTWREPVHRHCYTAIQRQREGSSVRCGERRRSLRDDLRTLAQQVTGPRS